MCIRDRLAPFVHPIRMIKDKPKGCAFVALTKIPNALGLVLENAVIAKYDQLFIHTAYDNGSAFIYRYYP